MIDKQPAEPSRELVWERVKKSAQEYHDHPAERGTQKLICIDADVSAQYVSDWKAKRSPIPMATLAKLANLYGKSLGYLAGYTDDPTPKASRDDAQINAAMAELVERAIDKSSEPVDAKMATRLCGIAVSMLQKGEPEALVLGTLINVAEGRDS